MNYFIHELTSRFMHLILKQDANESRRQYQLLKHVSSSIIKLHYLQISNNQLIDGQIQSTLTFDGNIREHWKRRKQKLELYLVATEKDK